MSQVTFKRGLFENLPEVRDDATFYYATDTHALYLGSHLIGDGVSNEAITALEYQIDNIDFALNITNNDGAVTIEGGKDMGTMDKDKYYPLTPSSELVEEYLVTGYSVKGEPTYFKLGVKDGFIPNYDQEKRLQANCELIDITGDYGSYVVNNGALKKYLQQYYISHPVPNTSAHGIVLGYASKGGTTVKSYTLCDYQDFVKEGIPTYDAGYKLSAWSPSMKDVDNNTYPKSLINSELLKVCVNQKDINIKNACEVFTKNQINNIETQLFGISGWRNNGKDIPLIFEGFRLYLIQSYDDSGNTKKMTINGGSKDGTECELCVVFVGGKDANYTASLVLFTTGSMLVTNLGGTASAATGVTPASGCHLQYFVLGKGVKEE